MSNEWTSSTDQCVSTLCVLKAYGIKPPLASAADVLMLTATSTKFVTDKVDARRVATMYEMAIPQYAWKEQLRTHAKNQICIPATEWLETFCTLIMLLLTLAMFPDMIQSYAAHERIAPLQARLIITENTRRS